MVYSLNIHKLSVALNLFEKTLLQETLTFMKDNILNSKKDWQKYLT